MSMMQAQYPKYLCSILFLCIILVSLGLIGIIIFPSHVDDNYYCTKLDNCTYTIAYYNDCPCQQCVVSAPGSDCPYYMPDETCPNTTICYIQSGYSCVYPNANFDFCKSAIPVSLLTVSILIFVSATVALFVIIFMIWKTSREYTKLINKSTGVMVVNY
jgi:hypothetical protein